MGNETDGNEEQFDVFLSHNSKDKPAVIQLAQALKDRGIKVWLDAWELPPGSRWQEELENIIRTTKTAAVLVGGDGLGPWEEPEMRACLNQFVRRKLPVIPVLLPGAPQKPELPLFLQEFTWLDLRDGLTEEAVDKLVWGITGTKPAKHGGKSVRRDTSATVDCWFSDQWPVTDPDIFGRENELALLDAAWDDSALNIVELVAAGGVGKTALVNRWVNYRMRPDGWRGAQPS